MVICSSWVSFCRTRGWIDQSRWPCGRKSGVVVTDDIQVAPVQSYNNTQSMTERRRQLIQLQQSKHVVVEPGLGSAVKVDSPDGSACKWPTILSHHAIWNDGARFPWLRTVACRMLNNYCCRVRAIIEQCFGMIESLCNLCVVVEATPSITELRLARLSRDHCTCQRNHSWPCWCMRRE